MLWRISCENLIRNIFKGVGFGSKGVIFFHGLWYILPNCLRKLGLIFHFLQQQRGSVHFLTLTISGIVLTSQKNIFQLFENVCVCVEPFSSSFSLMVLAFFLFICSIIVLFSSLNPAFYLREVVWRLQEESFGSGRPVHEGKLCKWSNGGQAV